MLICELSTYFRLIFAPILTFPAGCISESCIKIKINLNFYFHTSLWCRKRFYDTTKPFKPYKTPHKKSENKNLIVSGILLKGVLRTQANI